MGRIFFSLLNALQDIFPLLISLHDFFFLKKGSCIYIYKIYIYIVVIAIEGGGRPTRLLLHAKMLLIPIKLFFSAG